MDVFSQSDPYVRYAFPQFKLYPGFYRLKGGRHTTNSFCIPGINPKPTQPSKFVDCSTSQAISSLLWSDITLAHAIASEIPCYAILRNMEESSHYNHKEKGLPDFRDKTISQANYGGDCSDAVWWKGALSSSLKSGFLFSRFQVRHNVQLRTSTKDNNANPTWNESFKLLIHEPETQVYMLWLCLSLGSASNFECYTRFRQ